MTTRLINTLWCLTLTLTAGSVLSTQPVWAHGGGGGGGGGARMHTSSGSSTMNSFKQSGALAARSFKPSNLTMQNNNLSRNLTSAKLKDSKVLLPTNLTNNGTNLSKIAGLKPIHVPTTNGANTGVTGVGKLKTLPLHNVVGNGSNLAGINNIKSLPIHNITAQGPSSGNNAFLQHCGKFGGGCWPGGWFGPLGLYGYPYFGNYCGVGNNYGYPWYGSYAGPRYYNNTTVLASAPVPAVATTQGIDLALVDVRMLDNGDASKQIGPRYRVTFRNMGTTPVSHEFNVAVVAADTDEVTASSPMTESRVTSVPTGESSYVDVRLPATAFQMGSDAKSEFAKLLVILDSHQEVNDVNRDNNAAGIDRTAVQPAT